jgi:predicted nucleic acid-binding protein
MRYLADTSAIVRIVRKQAPASWDALIERGQVGICQAFVHAAESTSASGGPFPKFRPCLRARAQG